MGTFKFNCPRCSQSLKAPDDMLGQIIECPSCNSSIELPLPQATTKSDAQSAPIPPPAPKDPPQPDMMECPFCGEDILSKAKKCKHCGEFLDGRSSRENPIYEGKKSKVITENELWKGNPSFLYYLGKMVISVLFVLFCFPLIALYGVTALIFIGLGLMPLIYSILDRNTRTYILTNKRVYTKAGIISQHTHEVSIRDVRNLNVRQGVVERLLGLGTIEIGSAGTAGIEITFRGVKNPTSIRDKIRNQKDDMDG